MQRLVSIGFTVGIVFVAGAIVAWSLFGLRGETPKPQTSESETTTTVATPTGSEVASVIKIKSLRGKVISVTASDLSVGTGTQTETVSLSETKDFRRITSGSLESGQVKLAQATASDIKIGQEVLVVAQSDSPYALSILIIR